MKDKKALGICVADELKEELEKVIKKKLGKRYYQLAIVWEGGYIEDQQGTEVLLVGNMDVNKTPFNIFKSIIFSLFNAVHKLFQASTGIQIREEAPVSRKK